MTICYIPIRHFSERLAEGWTLLTEIQPGDFAAVMESPDGVGSADLELTDDEFELICKKTDNKLNNRQRAAISRNKARANRPNTVSNKAFSDDEVREIRKSRLSNRKEAKARGVSTATIDRIKCGLSYKWVEPA